MVIMVDWEKLKTQPAPQDTMLNRPPIAEPTAKDTALDTSRISSDGRISAPTNEQQVSFLVKTAAKILSKEEGSVLRNENDKSKGAYTRQNAMEMLGQADSLMKNVSGGIPPIVFVNRDSLLVNLKSNDDFQNYITASIVKEDSAAKRLEDSLRDVAEKSPAASASKQAALEWKVAIPATEEEAARNFRNAVLAIFYAKSRGSPGADIEDAIDKIEATRRYFLPRAGETFPPGIQQPLIPAVDDFKIYNKLRSGKLERVQESFRSSKIISEVPEILEVIDGAAKLSGGSKTLLKPLDFIEYCDQLLEAVSRTGSSLTINVGTSKRQYLLNGTEATDDEIKKALEEKRDMLTGSYGWGINGSMISITGGNGSRYQGVIEDGKAYVYRNISSKGAALRITNQSGAQNYSPKVDEYGLAAFVPSEAGAHSCSLPDGSRFVWLVTSREEQAAGAAAKPSIIPRAESAITADSTKTPLESASAASAANAYADSINAARADSTADSLRIAKEFAAGRAAALAVLEPKREQASASQEELNVAQEKPAQPAEPEATAAAEKKVIAPPDSAKALQPKKARSILKAPGIKEATQAILYADPKLSSKEPTKDAEDAAKNTKDFLEIHLPGAPQRVVALVDATYLLFSPQVADSLLLEIFGRAGKSSTDSLANAIIVSVPAAFESKPGYNFLVTKFSQVDSSFVK
jgi:hypothetical protein